MNKLNAMTLKIRVPTLIAHRRIWLGWKLEAGKKVPKTWRRERLVNARATAPSDALTLGEALDLYQRGLVDGIGFQLDGSGVVAIDLDDCMGPDGDLTPAARSLVEGLHSYTELSPSGCGLHILLQGAPPGNYKGGSIELYARLRFMTFTGQHLAGTPTTIEPREAEVSALYAHLLAERQTCQPLATSATPTPLTLDDDQVLRRAYGARNGLKVAALFDLGDARSYPSQSDAEFALLRFLHFWTQDVEQLDRLYRASKLARPKWDAVHGGDGRTYGQITLAKVLACGRPVYDPSWKGGR